MDKISIKSEKIRDCGLFSVPNSRRKDVTLTILSVPYKCCSSLQISAVPSGLACIGVQRGVILKVARLPTTIYTQRRIKSLVKSKGGTYLLSSITTISKSKELKRHGWVGVSARKSSERRFAYQIWIKLRAQIYLKGQGNVTFSRILGPITR